MKYPSQAKGVPEVSTLAPSATFLKSSDDAVGTRLEEPVSHSSAMHRCGTSAKPCHAKAHIHV